MESLSNNKYAESKDFTSLKCWLKGHDLRNFIYKSIVPVLPKHEEYNLKSQLKRAAVSVTLNIAEGYGRFHSKENIQFYRISRASAYEIKDHLITCKDFNYISLDLYDIGVKAVEAFKISIGAYINFKRKKNQLSN